MAIRLAGLASTGLGGLVLGPLWRWARDGLGAADELPVVRPPLDLGSCHCEAALLTTLELLDGLVARAPASMLALSLGGGGLLVGLLLGAGLAWLVLRGAARLPRGVGAAGVRLLGYRA